MFLRLSAKNIMLMSADIKKLKETSQNLMMLMMMGKLFEIYFDFKLD